MVGKFCHLHTGYFKIYLFFKSLCVLFLFSNLITQARQEYILVLITDIGACLQPLMDINRFHHCELLETILIYQIIVCILHAVPSA